MADNVSPLTRCPSGRSFTLPPLFDDFVPWNDQLGNNNSREALIHLRTEEREAEYSRIKKYRIFISTWNVNGQLSREEMAMRNHFLAMDGEAPDIYAIGFQELDLNKEAYVFDNYAKENYWLQMCLRSLHPSKQYKVIKSDRLIGMMLVIFANKELVPYISNIEAAHVGTGILGKMVGAPSVFDLVSLVSFPQGNKGGVAIRFDLHETSLCFVNCHLAAHVEHYERRNQDFREIRNRLQFAQSSHQPPRRIDDHDQVYWFGDLNYRVSNLSSEQIKAMCSRGQYSLILAHDQLKQQKELYACFEDYIEGPITHLPSFKYNTGTDEWDTSEKRRSPAWCDRILWRGKDIEQLAYRSHPQLKASDHKPVSALFDSSFCVIDQAAKRTVYEDVLKKLDKEENDYLPQVEIDSIEINFGTVRYRDSATRSLRVKNVGQSKVYYRFVNKPFATHYCCDWLRIIPASACIPRGESIEIKLELTFDAPTIATKLNVGIETLRDTLVLRLCGGKDIFVTVAGDYRPSCFGCSLETLVEMKAPMASITVEKMKTQFGYQVPLGMVKSVRADIEKKKDSNVELLLDLSIEIDEKQRQLDQLLSLASQFNHSTTEQADSIPISKELYFLVDYLVKYGLCKRGLFQSPGLESDFIGIRDALDRASPLLMLGVTADSVAEAMLLFLQSLPEPVIPFRFYSRVIAYRNNFSHCRQVINELPETHRKVFEYLILFLKELLKYSMHNNLNATIVAKIFGSILIRKPADENINGTREFNVHNGSPGSSSSTDLGQITLSPEQTFLYHFLCNSTN